MIIEGYWAKGPNDTISTYPWPVESDTPMINKDDFLRRLSVVETKALRESYRGISMCRCCGKMNGNAEYEFGGYQWPAGFRHYIEVHNIRPTSAFEQMIYDNS